MKVLVIGASGHIGNAIVRLLIKRKYAVTASGRRKTPPVNLTGLPITYLSVDVEKSRELERLVKGHDLVIDAAAPYPVEASSLSDKNGDEPVRIAEMRTQRLLDAVARYRARFAYVGSCVTVAHPRTGAQRLQRELMRIAHPYFHVKELMEEKIIDAYRRGIPAAIVDPAYCLGPWDVRDRKYCTIPLLLSGEIPSSIDQMLHVIDVRDVAEALLKILEDERYGEPILLSAYRMSTQHLYSTICEIAGVPAPRYSFPTEMVMLASYGLELVLRVAGIESPLSSGAIMISTAFDYVEVGQELARMGIKPRPLDQTIRDSIRWYRKIEYC